MLTKLNVSYEEFHVLDSDENTENFYQENDLIQLKLDLYEIESSGIKSDYYKNQQAVLNQSIDEHIKKSGMEKK